MHTHKSQYCKTIMFYGHSSFLPYIVPSSINSLKALYSLTFPLTPPAEVNAVPKFKRKLIRHMGRDQYLKCTNRRPRRVRLTPLRGENYRPAVTTRERSKFLSGVWNRREREKQPD